MVSNAELFQSDNCYTLGNDNTPHSEQLGTVLIRQLFTAQTRASSLYSACFVFDPSIGLVNLAHFLQLALLYFHIRN